MTGTTINQTPEQIARDRIDECLRAVGRAVQPAAAINLRQLLASRFGNTRQRSALPTSPCSGTASRLGSLGEAGRLGGEKITTVEQQSAGYAAAQLKWVKNPEPLPFIYKATGAITRFTDWHDPKPRSREVCSFH